MLASKVFESYVLDWALSQVKLKNNQFGGAKGCGASHLLISVWQKILTDLEDCRASTLLTAIDYAKAFNRMQFQECLRSFARHGASTEIIALVATFLRDRTMMVKVGSAWSRPREVHGGVPQGSILGVLLFNITTDNLEDEEPSTQDQHELTDASETDRSSDESSLSEDDHGGNDNGPEGAFSTPTLPEPPEFEPGITPFRRGNNNFVFLNSARNVRRALMSDPDLTLIRDRTIPDEPNPVTSAIWRPRTSDLHKYIDDQIIDTKLNMETVEASDPGNGTLPMKDKMAVSTQNMFRRIVHKARAIGMKVNSEKTQQICISDSLSFQATAHFFTTEGERVGTNETLKLLGFTFGQRPTCHAHIETIKRTFRGRYWLLIHLGQNGFSEDDLLKVYKTIIRPVAEYCAPVFHPMITDQQDEQLERLQSTALRYVYGYGLSYADMREKASLPTLRQRRIELTDKFARKCLQSERFSDWFPRTSGLNRRRSRHTPEFLETFARCDRLRNSPLHYMRRRLNGKEGKRYGERNRKYRDA